MVDSNLQRETISPMERAQAYKMKLEALKHQGKRVDLTCDQVGHKLDSKKSIQKVAEDAGESKTQVQRYIKIVLGGSVPTRWFADRNNLPNIFEFVDYAIVNEGEVPIVALVDYLEGRSSIQDVPQLFYLNDNKEITYNNLPISNPEICALPTPVFNKADIGRYLSPVPSLPLLGCRGCYWCKCTFCDHSFVYNNDYRPANMDKVLFDINNYIDEYNVRYINFHDEAMTPSGLLGLSNRLIEDGADIKWSTDARLDRGLTYDILKTAHKAGLSILLFGLESINNRVIKLMNKGTHVDVSKRILTDAKMVGIGAHCFFICGFPTETIGGVCET